jgi:soluble lytic murein transglycosylase
MGRLQHNLAIVGACAGLVIAGLAADVFLMPRPVPSVFQKLKDSPPSAMSQADLEELLGRVGPKLDVELRGRLAEAVLSESARAGYDPLFILALVSVESRFRPQVSSERGAYGLMQMKPSTFAWIAGREPDIGEEAMVMEDPVVDVRLAVRYFRWLERRFHTRDDALMAYNAGPKRLQQYKKSEIPDTLREYPRRVLKEYRKLVHMAKAKPDSRAVMMAQAN